jgi:hypothetical protein
MSFDAKDEIEQIKDELRDEEERAAKRVVIERQLETCSVDVRARYEHERARIVGGHKLVVRSGWLGGRT